MHNPSACREKRESEDCSLLAMIFFCCGDQDVEFIIYFFQTRRWRARRRYCPEQVIYYSWVADQFSGMKKVTRSGRCNVRLNAIALQTSSYLNPLKREDRRWMSKKWFMRWNLEIKVVHVNGLVTWETILLPTDQGQHLNNYIQRRCSTPKPPPWSRSMRRPRRPRRARRDQWTWQPPRELHEVGSLDDVCWGDSRCGRQRP